MDKFEEKIWVSPDQLFQMIVLRKLTANINCELQPSVVPNDEIIYELSQNPDHVVVIKYVPYVGDSKRAMDKYTSEIFMEDKNTIVMHSTTEDSLLAAPFILCLFLRL
ncbi:hypothetical protein REPUB_Repub15cG0062100 [Reevesia pubescens]